MEEAILKGWCCPVANLWRILLSKHITAENKNTYTLVFDGPTGCESLNAMNSVPLSAKTLEHIELFNNDPSRPKTTDAINNVYELPSIERAVRYPHGAVGFPTKVTWLSAIRKGNYLTWPLINVKNVNKHFPES